jgi:hypothetical protein
MWSNVSEQLLRANVFGANTGLSHEHGRESGDEFDGVQIRQAR